MYAQLSKVLFVLLIMHSCTTGMRFTVTLDALAHEASSFEVGAMLASVSLFPAFCAIAAGRWLDRSGPRPPLYLAILCAAGAGGATLLFPTASAGLAFVGIVEGTRVPDVVHRSVTLPELPPEWEGFRIAHLSDIHVSSIFRREHFEELVARTNALKADLVLITGDFVDGRVPVRYVDAEPLAKLTAPYGVWGCEGNHEHYSGLEEWLEVFPKLGIRLLRNEHTLLQRNGQSLALVGLTDSMAGRFGRETPDMRKAVSGIPEGVPHILLVHRPGEARRWAEEDPAAILQLSGHTHGGQILGMNLVVAMQNGGFVSGFYDVARKAGRVMRLFVHPGSGLWNGFAMRLGVPSEITLLTLTAGEKSTR